MLEVYVSYSPRSFEGIRNDVIASFGDNVNIVPVFFHRDNPVKENWEKLAVVQDDGSFEIIGITTETTESVVILNGGITPQTVAMVKIALQLRCKAYNLQRDGMVLMNI